MNLSNLYTGRTVFIFPNLVKKKQATEMLYIDFPSSFPANPKGFEICWLYNIKIVGLTGLKLQNIDTVY